MTKLNEIIQKILMVDTVSDDLNRANIEEWDSMTHLVLISEIEQTYDITLDEDDIPAIQSIKDLKTVLAKHNISD